jgi:hypothetical protein
VLAWRHGLSSSICFRMASRSDKNVWPLCDEHTYTRVDSNRIIQDFILKPRFRLVYTQLPPLVVFSSRTLSLC